MIAAQTLTIQGITVDCIIGDLAWERTERQPLRMDVEFSADFARVAQSDQLTDTIDYVAVADCVRATAAASSFQMIEALAAHLIRTLFAQFPLTRIALTLTKQAHFPGASAVIFRTEQSR